jgi:RHS repeat-associated protein
MRRRFVFVLPLTLLLGGVARGQGSISSSAAVVLPQVPATSYVVLSGQTVDIYSEQSVTLGPGVDLQAGSVVSVRVKAPVASDPLAGLVRNWTQSRSFAPSGAVIGEARQFYDNQGRLQQSQSKVWVRGASGTASQQVLASQVIPDAQGRAALVTLAAPINSADFAYRPNFVLDGAGNPYGYRNYDRFFSGTAEADKTNSPDPVGGKATAGTLGWYYSDHNTLEPYVPTTDYPFGRDIFYRDGTGLVKKSAGPGEAFRPGSGRETGSFRTAVVNELNDYLKVRNKIFAAAEVGALPSTLRDKASQVTSRDPNGNEAVVLQDQDGRTLVSTLPGSELPVTNTVTLYHSTGIQAHSFKLLSPRAVTVSGTGWKLYNMGDEQQVTGFVSGGTLPAGYYRLVADWYQEVTLTYPTGFSDASYYFYNQLGQLVASIAPEGVKKLYGAGLDAYSSTNRASIPFITLYEYDTQGRLVSQQEPDVGKSEFVYRRDGQIRFSQNAGQKKTGRFSYTHYDGLGRAVESGEYLPGTGGVAFNADLSQSSAMKSILEDVTATGGLTNGTQYEVVRTGYDLPDNGHGQAGYAQDGYYLRGAVSATEKYSTVANNTPSPADLVSKTWYSYDEQGRVTWTVRYLNGLGYKTMDYAYDQVGNVSKTVFQKGASAETFVHYFEYDDNQRLEGVYTNTSDNAGTRQLQARYVYYLHGPLKRVELADQLQGLDYTYTLQGWLKAINHPTQATDPGKDGSAGSGFAPDVFGLTLEYYGGDYARSGTGIGSLGAGAAYYNGTIRGQSWRSTKPTAVVTAYGTGVNDPAMQTYAYDGKYQLTGNRHGTPNFSTGSFTEAVNVNREHGLTYDAHGNLQSLVRTNSSGAAVDNFTTYGYQANTNKLAAVGNTTSTYATYAYDDLGQMTSEVRAVGGGYYLSYDVSGKVTAIHSDVNRTQLRVSYAYDEGGRRVRKTDHVQNFSTYYAYDASGSVLAIYDNNGSALQQKEVPVYASGRLGMYYRQANSYQYELSDHLGNVRAVIGRNKLSDGQAEVLSYSDYYPFGTPLTLQGGTYRHGYQGQYAERDLETGWDNFDLRMYSSRIGRWMTTDPYGQYHSPYVGMGNDPVNGVDPDGGFDTKFGAYLHRFASGNLFTGSEVYHNGNEYMYNTYSSSGWRTFDRHGVGQVQEVNMSFKLSGQLGPFGGAAGIELAFGNSSRSLSGYDQGFNVAARFIVETSANASETHNRTIFDPRTWRGSGVVVKGGLGVKVGDNPTVLTEEMKSSTNLFAKRAIGIGGNQGEIKVALNPNSGVQSYSVGLSMGLKTDVQWGARAVGVEQKYVWSKKWTDNSGY